MNLQLDKKLFFRIIFPSFFSDLLFPRGKTAQQADFYLG